jgi:hypothetical protein
MTDERTKLDWTRKYERLVREMLGYGRINSVPGDTEDRTHPHEGIDIGRSFLTGEAVEGATVRAPAAATVVRTGWIDGFGEAVVLERKHHGRTVTEIVGHLQKGSIPRTVVRGAKIGYGDALGNVGATGAGKYPHLHYETRIDADMAAQENEPRAAAKGFLWPHGKPALIDPSEVQDLSDLSRYTFGIEDPRVRRAVEAQIRTKYDRAHTGDVRGVGPEFDRDVRAEALRKAGTMLSLDQLAKLSEDDFAWATHGDYWRRIMDPNFKP